MFAQRSLQTAKHFSKDFRQVYGRILNREQRSLKKQKVKQGLFEPQLQFQDVTKSDCSHRAFFCIPLPPQAVKCQLTLASSPSFLVHNQWVAKARDGDLTCSLSGSIPALYAVSPSHSYCNIKFRVAAVLASPPRGTSQHWEQNHVMKMASSLGQHTMSEGQLRAAPLSISN